MANNLEEKAFISGLIKNLRIENTLLKAQLEEANSKIEALEEEKNKTIEFIEQQELSLLEEQNTVQKSTRNTVELLNRLDEQVTDNCNLAIQLENIDEIVSGGIGKMKQLFPSMVSVPVDQPVAEKARVFCEFSLVMLKQMEIVANNLESNASPQQIESCVPRCSRSLAIEDTNKEEGRELDLVCTTPGIFPVSLASVKVEEGLPIHPKKKHTRDVGKGNLHLFKCKCGMKFAKRRPLDQHILFWKHEFLELKRMLACKGMTRNKLAYRSKAGVKCGICSTTLRTRKALYAHRLKKHGLLNFNRKTACNAGFRKAGKHSHAPKLTARSNQSGADFQSSLGKEHTKPCLAAHENANGTGRQLRRRRRYPTTLHNHQVFIKCPNCGITFESLSDFNAHQNSELLTSVDAALDENAR